MRPHRYAPILQAFLLILIIFCLGMSAQENKTRAYSTSSQDLNKRLEALWKEEVSKSSGNGGDIGGNPDYSSEYRIGPDDLLDISTFEAQELKWSVRVRGDGRISLPLLGEVRASGLTPRELEVVLQEILRRTYLKDPHVGVFVREMRSHTVAIFGAVAQPGVYQISGPKSVVEVLSLSAGLAADAGDVATVRRGPYWRAAVIQAGEVRSRPSDGAQEGLLFNSRPNGAVFDDGQQAVRINLKSLLESGESRHNILVYPGDTITVNRAGIVYVVGGVREPGGFVLKSNESISALQALALAAGLTKTSAKGRARIIRTDPSTGERYEIPLDLGKVLEGKASDPALRPKDILFVPDSAVRAGLLRTMEAVVSVVSGLIIFRR